MFRKLSVAVVSGVVASTVLTVSPLALAAGDEPLSRIVLRDAARDVWGSDDPDEEPSKVGAYPVADVRRAVVAHRANALVVRMRFANLRRVGEQYYPVFITMPDGWYNVAFVITRPGHRRGTHHLAQARCRDFTHKVDYANDVVILRIPRKCLGNPEWVRVSMDNYVTFGGSWFEGDWDEIYFDNPHSPRPRGGTTPRLYRG
jgi:hypothetical protein